MTQPVHATCIAIDGWGVLLCGASGSGKSDLALRLLDRGAALVSDDYTSLSMGAAGLMATAPATIAGQLEVRGLGIIDWPALPTAPVILAVLLDAIPVRMPPEPWETRSFEGVQVPVVALSALESSAPIKVELATRALIAARQ